jgi:hypothetical protein
MQTAIGRAVETPLVRTASGRGLHLADCPHVRGCAVHVAVPEELDYLPVCGWSQAELDGVGRRYFATLSDAMRCFGTHVGTERAIRESVAAVLHDQIWVPNSGAYIALGLNGVVTGCIGKSYVQLHGGRLLTLSDYASGSGGGVSAEPRYGAVCPRCRLSLPLTGRCDECD